MALNAIAADAKYLFFIGDDVVIPNHALRSLIYKMDQRPDIGVIGGVYCAKANPPFPLVFRGNGVGSYWDWKVGEFFEVTGLGMDCTIIRVSLLKELHEKGGDLFKTVKSDKFLDGINSAEEWTEDLFFLNRVTNETNAKIYCDGSIICSHWDVYGDKSYTLPKDSLPLRQLGVDGEMKKLLDIGGHLPEQPGFIVVTAGDRENLDYRCEYSDLPFEADQFEFVNIGNVVSTVERVHVALNEAARVLAIGGTLKYTYTNAFNPEWIVEVFKAAGLTVVSHANCLIEGTKHGNTKQDNSN
jgi:hypothetical protein